RLIIALRGAGDVELLNGELVLANKCLASAGSRLRYQWGEMIGPRGKLSNLELCSTKQDNLRKSAENRLVAVIEMNCRDD
ncbi:MAG: hypothetical protein NXI22_19225, partial [bacterium]|nr:hypothetical protein [bacterium]